MRKLLAKIRKILKDRRTRQLLTRTVSVTAAIVVFVTTYALVLPAITMETEADCGVEAHQHDSSCYEDFLICGEEDSSGHQHTDSCYEQALICGKESHTHSAACYSHSNSAASVWSKESAAVAATDNSAAGITVQSFMENEETADHDSSAFSPFNSPVIAENESADASDEYDLTIESTDETDDTYGGDSETDDPLTENAVDLQSEDPTTAGENITTDDNATIKDNATTDENVAADENEASDTTMTTEVADSSNSANNVDTFDTSETNNPADSTNIAITDYTEVVPSKSSTTSDSSFNDGTTVSANVPTASTASTASTEAVTSTASTDTNASSGSAASTAAEASLENAYVPVLDPLDFNQILTDETGIYYFHTQDKDNAPENSGDITDWVPLDDKTILDPADIIRVYLAYSIPAGSLNSTNPVARYRMPSNLHLSDNQVESINSTVNGIANLYVSLDTLEIIDSAKYRQSLGVEAIEGTRKPSDEPEDYFAKHTETDSREYISATVKVEDIYDIGDTETVNLGTDANDFDSTEAISNTATDEEKSDNKYAANNQSGTYLGTDLVFTFTSYSVQKNQHTYDSTGKPTSAGQRIQGWLTFDLRTDQIDFETLDIETEVTEDAASADADTNTESGDNETVDMKSDTTGNGEPVKADSGQENDTANAGQTSAVSDDSSDKETGRADQGTKEDTDTNVAEDKTSTTASEISEQTSITTTTTTTTTTTKEAIIVFVPETKDLDSGLNTDEITQTLRLQEIVTELSPASKEKSEDEDKGADSDKGTDADKTVDSDKGADSGKGADSDDSSKDDKAEKPVLHYPALTFRDSITASMGTLSTDTEIGQSTVLPDETELTVYVEADEGTFPEGTTMKLSTVEDMDTVASAVEEAVTAHDDVSNKTCGFHAVDISFWNTEGIEIEPLNPIRVSIKSESIRQAVEDTSTAPVVVHVTDPATNQDTVNPTDEDESYDSGEDNNASNPETAGDPEIEKHTSDNGDIESPIATIVDTEKQASNENDEANDTDTLTFETGNFSIYAIVYTVDFHWEVNGKVYDFSIPGGGFVTLQQLVEVLGIAESDTFSKNVANSADNSQGYYAEDDEYSVAEEPGVENGVYRESKDAQKEIEQKFSFTDVQISEKTRKFVADVMNVEISSPELVWVGKIDENSTVGKVKERNGIKSQFSAELTENQINTINNSVVESGDWALISMHPFTSEEVLTITMNNGDILSIQLTDAQITSIHDGHKYVIYYFDYEDGNYYVLKGDGSTELLNISGGVNNKLNSLSDDYLWTFEFISDNNSWNVYSISNLFLTLDSTRAANGTVINTTPTQNGLDFEYDADTAAIWGYYGIEGWGWVVSDATSNWNKYYLTPDFGHQRMIAQNYGLYDDRDAYVALFDQTERRMNFTVKTEFNNTYRGTVGGKDFTQYVNYADKGYSYANNVSERDHLASYISITTMGNNTAKNQYEITAEAGVGYRFEYWKLDDQIVDRSLYKQRQVGTKTEYYIEAGTLTIEKENQVLTAVFSKIPDSELGVPDYADLINNWKQAQVNDPLFAEKTAEVYDYDNRIYEIDITASGNRKIIQPDIELSFVTDISRSMYFPSSLKKVNVNNSNYNHVSNLVWQLNQLRQNRIAENQSADHDSVYYILANQTSDATVYAVRYRNNRWEYIDASYDTLVHDKTGAPGANQGQTWDFPWILSSTDYGMSIANNKTANGEIYVANDAVYRLEYLQQAVDIASEIIYLVNDDAKVGLVTFAAAATDEGMYSKGQYSQLISTLNSISPTGSTDQLFGLRESYAAFGRNKETDENGNDIPKKRVVIMITDGAPNNRYRIIGYEPNYPYNPIYGGDPDLSWTNIMGAADNLEEDYDATVYTIGVAVNGIKGTDPDTNQTVDIINLLKKTATEERYGFNAPTGRELVQAILDIVEGLITPVDLYGQITDTVDPAFYPVNADGTPVTAGYYKYKEDGSIESMDPSEIDSFNESLTPYYQWSQRGESWIITWYNVEYKKATVDANDNIVPGVHKSFLIKAKEDFLGGNTIKTNSSKARVIADYYREHLEPGQTKPEEDLLKGKLKTPITREMETPYVNIDELEMNDHHNTWTVYLGTNVNPYTQLKEMYNDILIREVVTQSKDLTNQLGITWASSQVVDYEDNNPEKQGTTIYQVQKGAWEDDDETLKGLMPSTFTLASVINTIQKSNYTDTLFSRLVSGEEVVLKYYGSPAYGHGTEDNPVGTITFKIEKSIALGEGGIPDPHDTSVTNEENGNNPVESYSLSVVYNPTAPKSIEYHTGRYVIPEDSDKHPGAATDQMTSSNTHIINVFEKKLQIEKRDKETGELITDKSATFTLYKSMNNLEPQKSSDIVSENGTVASGYEAVAVMTTNTSGNDAGKTNVYVVEPLHFGMFANDADKTTTYFLIETQQPEGYLKSTQVWPVTLVNSETPTNEAGAAAVASTLPYDWTQTATLIVGGQTSTDNSETVTVTFSVENEKGVDIEILKVDEKGEPLNLATFRLQKKEGSYQDIKSIKISTDSEDLKYPSVGGLDENSSFISGTEKVTITKLPDGEYRLVEDSTYDGYIIKQKEIDFTITNGILEGTDIDGVVTFDTAKGSILALITITNEPGAALPSTGGHGTTMIYLFGIMFIGFAGVGMAMRKRRKAA